MLESNNNSEREGSDMYKCYAERSDQEAEDRKKEADSFVLSFILAFWKQKGYIAFHNDADRFYKNQQLTEFKNALLSSLNEGAYKLCPCDSSCNVNLTTEENAYTGPPYCISFSYPGEYVMTACLALRKTGSGEKICYITKINRSPASHE